MLEFQYCQSLGIELRRMVKSSVSTANMILNYNTDLCSFSLMHHSMEDLSNDCSAATHFFSLFTSVAVKDVGRQTDAVALFSSKSLSSNLI
jgi:hypothetical protein